MAPPSSDRPGAPPAGPLAAHAAPDVRDAAAEREPTPSSPPRVSGAYPAFVSGRPSALRPRAAPSLEPPPLPSTDRVLGRLAAAMAQLDPLAPEARVVEVFADLLGELLPQRSVAIHTGDDGAPFPDPEGPRAPVFPGAVDGVDVRAELGGRVFAVISIERTDTRDGDLALDANVASSAAPFLAAALRTARAVQRRSLEVADLRAQLVRADRLATVGRFAAETIHEFNNPLTAIVAYTDLLAQRGAPSDPEQARLERIREAAARIRHLARRLLGYARPAPEPAGVLPATDAVEQALSFCEHVVSASGATVERRYAQPTPSVLGGRAELTQVFVNLITNACQALADVSDPRLLITARGGAPGRVVMTVEDNGAGIPADELPRIFEPFFTTKGAQGTGLGLSIVRYILDAHGARVRVESRPGLGTRFELDFPAHD